ncbi:hypothetical protein CDAR_44711 [Caerostris darwini]|uniref:Uncharacterized protein n=1 Tax=Caerostris darwini TaxID=1538125 RepID=A0AAV4SRQ7_9ARAC|nr:hypothetical protein CDAR_44711 [Caerostris darwini]
MNIKAKLTTKRKGIRTAFTFSINKMTAEFSKVNPDVSKLSVLETQFEDKFEKLANYQKEAEKALLQSAEYPQQKGIEIIIINLSL